MREQVQQPGRVRGLGLAQLVLAGLVLGGLVRGELLLRQRQVQQRGSPLRVLLRPRPVLMVPEQVEQRGRQEQRWLPVVV